MTLRSGIAAGTVVATALLLPACGGGSSEEPAAEGVAGPSEIRAEPLSSAGDNPFTAPAGKDTAGIEPPPGVVAEGGRPPTYDGDLPGLYGGTRDYATCDARKLIRFLEQNPSKAAAWADTLGIEVTDIRRYVNGLTPVLLRTDTRVTNHGYSNGVATPVQAVLQAGTAVFVNQYGEPVVKCYCGNPLTRPLLYARPRYVGPLWTGFHTTHITIINRSTTIINTYTLYDPKTGKTFARPAGTSGAADDPPTDSPVPSDADINPMMPSPDQPQPAPAPPVEQPPPATTTPSDAPESPAASFSPNPGRQGDTFVLSALGFRPGATLDVTLTRPDGHVEHYPIPVGGDGTGSRTFTGTEDVITGTYTAVVTNPATGATASTSVLVQPAGG